MVVQHSALVPPDPENTHVVIFKNDFITRQIKDITMIGTRA